MIGIAVTLAVVAYFGLIISLDGEGGGCVVSIIASYILLCLFWWEFVLGFTVGIVIIALLGAILHPEIRHDIKKWWIERQIEKEIKRQIRNNELNALRERLLATQEEPFKKAIESELHNFDTELKKNKKRGNSKR